MGKMKPDSEVSQVNIIGRAKDWDIQETRPPKYNRVEFTIQFNLLNFRCWTTNDAYYQFIENLEHIAKGQKIKVSGYLWLFNGHQMRLMVTHLLLHED